MKEIRNFLNFVEISTKLASVIPFSVGVGYTLYRFGSVKPWQTLVFFTAMLLFDMTTTAINNHIGNRQTGRKPHYLTEVSIALIFVMGLTAVGLGIYLAWMSGIVILFAGIFCFGIGVVYSYGPLPIARTPFGELFSTVMGFFVPFIALQISHPIISVAFDNTGEVVIAANVWEILSLGVVVMPLVCCIANIMLANNICDMDEDVEVKRYTFPFFIGIKRSLRLYALLYVAAFAFIGIGAAFGIIPIYSVATALIGAWFVRKNIRLFFELQDKRQTFFTVILNFLFICVPYSAWFWIGTLLAI